nr:MAG TPA: hypothetical protein [Caudoviricetes sp.]
MLFFFAVISIYSPIYSGFRYLLSNNDNRFTMSAVYRRFFY